MKDDTNDPSPAEPHADGAAVDATTPADDAPAVAEAQAADEAAEAQAQLAGDDPGEQATPDLADETPAAAVDEPSGEALTELKRILEAALLVAGEPVPAVQLARLFEPALDADTTRKLLVDLQQEWSGRKVELVQVASGWRFQGATSMSPYLARLSPEKPPRYSRAVMETLAIIAYQQPVTRGDIEAIRGVAVSTNVIKTLEDRQWVEIVGHRETPGRPALYATTKVFLDDLGLRSLAELPHSPSSIPPIFWRCPMPPPRPPRRHSPSRVRSSGAPSPTQQPNLALHAIKESLPPQRIKRSTDEIFSEPQRLHKVLASCGFGSRRAMEEMILAGRITVNRLPAEVGQKVGPEDEVRINGELVKVRFTAPRPRVLMYHKPAGEIVTRDDPEGRPTVFAKLPNIGNGKWINVGRLDYNTEGLLLFTNSGELANRLMHPRYEVEREYAVRVMGRMTDEQMQSLTTGITLEDGVAKCEKVEDGGGEDEGANHWYHVVLKEGRNREVRRLFEALGLTVSRLIRTRYGTLAMPSVLKRNDVLELEGPEVEAVLAAAGLKPGGGQQQQRAQGGRPQQGQPRRPQGPKGAKPGQRPHGNKQRFQGKRPNAPGGEGAPRPQPQQGGGRPDFDVMQPQSNANAIGLRPAGAKRQRGNFGKGGFGGNKGGFAGGGQGGQRPQQNRQRINFDEMQPLSNANASPFGRTTLTVPGAVPPGVPGVPGNRPNRGNRGRPAGKGGDFRGKGGGGKGRPHGAPRGEVNGNVAPRGEGRARREVDGNVAVAEPRVPRDDE
ncbi:MAG: SMC-Scp complex subunit ScpB [Burkholderiales bacterium]